MIRWKKILTRVEFKWNSWHLCRHIPMTSCPLVKTKTYDEQSSKNWQFLSPPLATAFKDGAPSGHLGTTHTAMHLHILTTRKRSWGKVMFLLVPAILFTGGGGRCVASQYASQVTCPASKEGLPTGGSAYRESGYRRVCLQGSVSRGSAYRGSASRRSVYRGSAYRGSASRGSANRGICIGGIGQTHHQN